jgi:energy-coupling factor transport system ATP-binding protein
MSDAAGRIPGGAPVIEFTGFSFRYKAQNAPTLVDVNAAFYAGEKVLIIGSSGSGKSTLAHCINGLIPFSYTGDITGSCKVNGVDTATLSVFDLSRSVGTILQDSDAQFVGLSVGEDAAFAMENNAVPHAEMHCAVAKNTAVVGMDAFLDALPYHLSGGQKQKAAIAGILDEDTHILIFDEPLAALDPRSGMDAIEMIDRIACNHTVIIIEHRLEDVLHRGVDRVIVMDNGKIAADTTPDDLLKSTLLHGFGIREPLYVTAMKYAGVDVTKVTHLSDLAKIKFSDDDTAKLTAFFTTPTIAKKRDLGDVAVTVDHLSFAYDTRGIGLTDVSFSLRRGERIAVIGKNGAGKSTLAKLLCGILRPDTGTITLGTTNSAALSVKQIAEHVGYVMQDPNQMLVKDVIKDEVELALRLRGFDDAAIADRVKNALEACGMYRMRNWPVDAVSYGQRKRITIAAVLALESDVLVLDEPTAGQDWKHYTDIMDFIAVLNRDFGKTIIFITHDIHLAIEHTDRALVFADGQLIADGTVFSVLSDAAIVERSRVKPTSLYTLAEKLGLPGEKCIERYINYEAATIAAKTEAPR